MCDEVCYALLGLQLPLDHYQVGAQGEGALLQKHPGPDDEVEDASFVLEGNEYDTLYRLRALSMRRHQARHAPTAH